MDFYGTVFSLSRVKKIEGLICLSITSDASLHSFHFSFIANAASWHWMSLNFNCIISHQRIHFESNQSSQDWIRISIGGDGFNGLTNPRTRIGPATHLHLHLYQSKIILTLVTGQ